MEIEKRNLPKPTWNNATNSTKMVLQFPLWLNWQLPDYLNWTTSCEPPGWAEASIAKEQLIHHLSCFREH